MFGFRYVKSSLSQYLFQYRNGRVVREGTGLAFWYFAPQTTLVGIPVTAVEAPFMFEEVTRDFQQVTLQGQVSYRIADPKRLGERDLGGADLASDLLTNLNKSGEMTTLVDNFTIARSEISSVNLRAQSCRH